MGWFKKKPVKSPLEIATQTVLKTLQQGELHNKPLPFISYFNRQRNEGVVGLRDRWLITVAESEPGVIQLSMKDTRDRRDQKLTAYSRSDAELVASLAAWREPIRWWYNRLTLYRLQPGKTYRVIKTFTDHYGSVFEAGRELKFLGRSFVPYHGGHTLGFEPSPVYFQEDQQSDIIDDFDLYFEDVSSGQ